VDSGPSDRSQLAKAKADIEELKVQELEGRLVSVDAIAETMSSLATA
jgi:phage terminase Nu1 subunit (DNA packaging protein)